MRLPRRLSARVLVPGAEPFLLRGGPTACLLVHGYTAFPEEMRPLGDDLAAAGHTVLGIRLAGHGTDPRDLGRVRAADWLADVEAGLALLAEAERAVLVGQSLGAVVVLAAAAALPVAGVVALSAPAELGPDHPGPERRGRGRLAPKQVERDPELGLRRERDYPAYAAGHTRAEREIAALHRRMLAGLAAIRAPVLLVSSDGDPWFPGEHGRRLHAALRAPRNELLVVDGLDHAISRDPGRRPVVEAILRFLGSL